MKKIFLLIALVTFFFAASAQDARVGNENLPGKNSQISTSVASSEGLIENITVYPNPVADVLKIAFKGNGSGLMVISIFNNIGKQVYSQQSEVAPGNNIYSIDIRNSAIESGIYFVKCTADDLIITRKLIVK